MRANFIVSGVLNGLRRNIAMTIALVLNTTISLAFLGAAFLSTTEIDRFRTVYQDKLNVSVYLCTQVTSNNKASCEHVVTPDERAALESRLTADPQVASFTYLTQEDAFARYKQVAEPSLIPYTTANDLPASFVLKLKNLRRDFETVKTRYEGTPGVDKIVTPDVVIETLLKTLDRFRLAFFVIALGVLICAILVMSNTIQVSAQQRRNETGIMRLVGASRTMTEFPFVIEAVIATVLGGILAVVVCWLGKTFILNGVFHTQVNRGLIPDLTGNDVIKAGLEILVVSIVLAAITAFTTLRLYVRL